jgi:hypothetical protein
MTITMKNMMMTIIIMGNKCKQVTVQWISGGGGGRERIRMLRSEEDDYI